MSYKDWPPAENYPPPALSPGQRVVTLPGGVPVIDCAFQRSLTKIAGTYEGYPILRLVWGQSETEFFDGARMVRYRYSRQTRHTGWLARFPDGDRWFPPSAEPPAAIPRGVVVRRTEREVEIGIPRFLVEQFYPWNGEDAESYEADRWAYDPETGRRIDVNGEMPPVGTYHTAFHLICEHSSGCCAAARDEGQRCFGRYRDPEPLDLEYCAALWRLNEAEPERFRWTDAPPRGILERRIRNRWRALAEEKERERAQMRSRILDTIRLSSKRIFGEGHGPDLHRYVDMGGARPAKENH